MRSVLWGIAAALKLFPAVYLLPLLSVQHKRVGFKDFLVALLVTVLGAAVVGWDQTSVYITEVIPTSRNFYPSFGNNSLVAAGTALASPLLGWILEVLGGSLIAILMLKKPGGIDRVLGNRNSRFTASFSVVLVILFHSCSSGADCVEQAPCMESYSRSSVDVHAGVVAALVAIFTWRVGQGMVPGCALWGICVFALCSYLWAELSVLDRFQTGGVRPIRVHTVQSCICKNNIFALFFIWEINRT